MILRYDGSLSGFFCLLGSAVKERLPVERIERLRETPTGDLFCRERTIVSDHAWAATVAAGLRETLGERFVLILVRALYSEESGIERALLLLTRHALHHGRDALDDLTHPLVDRTQKAALRTARERHRLLGLLRFARLADDSYLARCSPRANVVPLLGAHFCGRLGSQRWLIVDDLRKLGVFGEHGRWQAVEQVELAANLIEHGSESEITDLWRGFYRSVSNPERYNPGLRAQFMPKRYWRYLTELQADSNEAPRATVP